MKLLIILGAFFASATTFACANFSGNFTCTIEEDNYTYALKVEQTGNVFRITDDEGTDEFVADGQRRSIPDDVYQRNVSYKATCQADSVVLSMMGEIFDADTGQSFPFSANITHQMVTRSHVTQTTQTEVLGQSTTSITQCRRN